MKKPFIIIIFCCLIGNLSAQSGKLRGELYQQGEWMIHVGHNVDQLIDNLLGNSSLILPDTRIAGSYTIKDKLVLGAFFHYEHSLFIGDYHIFTPGLLARYYLNSRRLSPFAELAPAYSYGRFIMPDHILIPGPNYLRNFGDVLGVRIGLVYRGEKLGIEASIAQNRWLRNPFASSLLSPTIQIGGNWFLHK